MIYLTLDEVIALHHQVVVQSGGSAEIHKLGEIESAVAQPRMTFGGEDLYPTLVEKAAAFGFSLACNHGFIDGNKRIGHAAMEVFLVLNGYELVAPVDEAEDTFLKLADHKLARQEFLDWVQQHVQPL